MMRNQLSTLFTLPLLCAALACAPAHADNKQPASAGNQAKTAGSGADARIAENSANTSEDKSENRRKELRKAAKQREQRQHNTHKT
ncbi:MAG: hypothetical protein JO002_16000 [Burkholderiaceae bacterium]|nr:hypothetical protein [Burkholderiaceae bacterium]